MQTQVINQSKDVLVISQALEGGKAKHYTVEPGQANNSIPATVLENYKKSEDGKARQAAREVIIKIGSVPSVSARATEAGNILHAMKPADRDAFIAATDDLEELGELLAEELGDEMRAAVELRIEEVKAAKSKGKSKR